MRLIFLRLSPFRLATSLALVSWSWAWQPVQAQQPDQGSRRGPSFWQAGGGVAATNWITWGYNRYVQRWPWSKVGWNSWRQNLRLGFTWDDNTFSVNQLAHPYHGSFYLGSARASGYNFWESVPFVLLGSASWEFFGENIQPSLNDLITTTLGGLAVGELTYRLSSSWQDGMGGRSGIGRLLGSFVLNPLGRTQRLVRHPPEAGSPERSTFGDGVRLAAGRYRGRTFFQLNLQSRSPFDPAVHRPYDAFELDVQVGPRPFSRIAISGVLARHSLLDQKDDDLVLALFQHYDYTDAGPLKSGGQSLSGAVWFRHSIAPRTQLEFGLHAEGVVLGGLAAEYGNYWRRDYDLGPGAGARFESRFVRDGREWLRVESRLLWLHSVHGSGGDHLATTERVTVSVPVINSVGFGGEFVTMGRHSRFPGQPSVYRKTGQIRTFLAWTPP